MIHAVIVNTHENFASFDSLFTHSLQGLDLREIINSAKSASHKQIVTFPQVHVLTVLVFHLLQYVFLIASTLYNCNDLFLCYFS